MPAKITSAADLPTLPFATARSFADWLAKNHATSRGRWIRIAKAQSGIASVGYAEALEVALCWGWIDSQSRGIDETWYLQNFTPRGARSSWSKINCAKATRLRIATFLKMLARREKLYQWP